MRASMPASARRTRFWRGGSAALLAAGALSVAPGACGREDPAARIVAFPAIQTDSGVRIGTVEAAGPAGAIGRVVAARFTAGGDRVVVLDYAPPYVKVFRRDGTLETAFLGRGGGPMEIRDPAALAVAGDSLILVADGSRRVATFGMDGRLHAQGRTGFPVLTASACGGEWIVYGPTFQSGSRPSWLHRITVGADGVRALDLEFLDAPGGGVIGNGLPYGLAHVGDTVRVWHVLGATPAVLGWTCGATGAHAWHVRPLADRSTTRAEGEAVRMSVRPGQRTVAGMAAVPGGVVLAAHVVPRPGEPRRTELTLVTRRGERHIVAVDGAYTLRDGHPGAGVLVSVNDPVPRLFTISTSDLHRLFGPYR